MENPKVPHYNHHLPHLTTDLIIEILLRLPVKPLARFKLVSKSWYALINSRHFIISHISHSLSTFTNLHLSRLCTTSSESSLVTLHLPALDSSPPRYKKLPFTLWAEDSDIIASSHGILCISDHPNYLALFNPTTITHHFIPVGAPVRQPESHWVDFGFGYDSSADDYKVLRVDQLNVPGSQTRAPELQVYSFNEKTWRIIETRFPHFLAHPTNHGKFLNGSVFWMATVNPPAVYDWATLQMNPGHPDTTEYKYLIVEFNLNSETFDVIEIPECRDQKGNIAEFPKPWLEVLGDALCVRYDYGPMKERSMDVWVKKEKWVKLFSFPYEVARPESKGRPRPLWLSKDGKEVLIEHNFGRVYYWVDWESRDFRDVKLRGHLPSHFRWTCGHASEFGGVAHVDSLVVLDNHGLELSVKPVDYKDPSRFSP